MVPCETAERGPVSSSQSGRPLQENRKRGGYGAVFSSRTGAWRVRQMWVPTWKNWGKEGGGQGGLRQQQVGRLSGTGEGGSGGGGGQRKVLLKRQRKVTLCPAAPLKPSLSFMPLAPPQTPASWYGHGRALQPTGTAPDNGHPRGTLTMGPSCGIPLARAPATPSERCPCAHNRYWPAMPGGVILRPRVLPFAAPSHPCARPLPPQPVVAYLGYEWTAVGFLFMKSARFPVRSSLSLSSTAPNTPKDAQETGHFPKTKSQPRSAHARPQHQTDDYTPQRMAVMTPQRMTPQRMTPQRMTPQLMTPQRMTPQHMTPQRMTPQRMAPQRMTPQRMTPQRMAP
jgi:hypothetical protein